MHGVKDNVIHKVNFYDVKTIDDVICRGIWKHRGASLHTDPTKQVSYLVSVFHLYVEWTSICGINH